MLGLATWLACTPQSDSPDPLDPHSTTAPSLVDDVAVRLHPEIESLLYISWNQAVAADAHVEYRFDDEVWLATPMRAIEAGPAEALVLGVPYDMAVELRVVVDDGTGAVASASQTTRTGEIPEAYPMHEVRTSLPKLQDPAGRYLLGSVSAQHWMMPTQDFWTFILDRAGRPVWVRETPDLHWTDFVRVSEDGHDLLIDDQTWFVDFDEGAGSTVHRTKLDLVEIETIAAPGLHHAFVDLPDGSIVWGDGSGRSEKVVRRAPDGSLTELWNCGSLFGKETCLANSLAWSAATGTYLLSLYTHDTVVEIDATTGATVRTFGGFAESTWGFDPADSAFFWQHGVAYTEAGTLLLSSKAGTHLMGEHETVAREYVLDTGTETLRQIWSFGEGEGVYAIYGGDTHRLSNGNTLHSYGVASRAREVTREGEVVWDLDWGDGKNLGRTVFIEDLYALAP
jgi:hypothetical protein